MTIYVYIKNGGIIAKKSINTKTIVCDKVMSCNFKIDDNLIYEFGKVIKYKDSQQYKEDMGILGLEEEKKKIEEELKKQKLKTEQLMKDNIKLKTEFDLIRKMNEKG